MARAGAAVLSLREVGFAYPGRPVFTRLSADFGPGVTWVVGDEGSGKTTLLKLVAGVLRGSGHILIDGVEAAGPAAVAWCEPRDETHDGLGVGAFVDRLRQAAPAFDADALEHHFDGFDLRPHLGKSMFQLSTGTRRKVGLAAALAMRAPVLLLDDPAAALDGPSVAHLMRALAEADREPSRTCLVAVYAVPPGIAAPRTFALPPVR